VTWRCLFDHADGAPYLSDGLLRVRCADCGRESGGLMLSPAYRETQAGDPYRVALHKIRIAVDQWKKRHAA